MGNPHHRKHGGETEKAWRKDRGAQARKAKAKAGTAGGGDAAGGGGGGPVVSEPVWWRASFPVARGEPSEVVLGKAEGGGPALSGFCPFSQNLEVREMTPCGEVQSDPGGGGGPLVGRGLGLGPSGSGDRAQQLSANLHYGATD